MLVSCAEPEPDARKVKRRPGDFLKFESIAIETPRAFQIVDADEKVMKEELSHGEDDRASAASWKWSCVRESYGKFALAIVRRAVL
jgi:hypothetical protein